MSDTKIALITGSNKGIGLETVRQLAEKGFRVYLAARKPELGKKAADTMAKNGVDVRFLELDVTSKESVEKAAKAFGTQEERLDVLINNAGIYPDENKTILEVNPELFFKTITTNTLGPILVTQAFLPYLEKSGGAKVINLSSGLGALSDMGGVAPSYSISKTALNAVTRQFAAVLQDKKISVNSVCPGWVRTEMGTQAAPRSVEEGASGIVWLATEAPLKLTGQFFRDGKELKW